MPLRRNMDRFVGNAGGSCKDPVGRSFEVGPSGRLHRQEDSGMRREVIA